MSHLTRRKFLEQSMLSTAAAAALGVVRPLRANEAAKSKSPNDRLGVAVIGVHGRGAGHLSDIHDLAEACNLEIVAICDPDEQVGQSRVEEISKKQGRAPKFVRDLRHVFNDPAVDAITIATPNHWHALASIWAMQAGKDVYVEKPVSHNVSEGRRMVEAARHYGRICQTGTQCRSQPGTIQAIEYVQAGKIGKVKVARGLCYKSRGSIGARGTHPVPSYIDFNLWLGPAAEAPLTRPNLHYDWHWQWAYGNGDLGNQGIHQMDIARWGLGADRLSNSVLSYGGRLGYEDAGETANTQTVIHDYGDAQLVFEVRGLKTDPLKGAGVGVIFEGTDGYVVLSSYDSGAAFDPAGREVAKFSGGGDHFENFFRAVRSRRVEELAADVLEGHLSSALCHLGNISYRLGSRVPLAEAQSRLAANSELAATFERVRDHLEDNGVSLENTPLLMGEILAVDPVRESFVNQPTADGMLTREYRAPFVVPAAGNV